MAQTTEIHSVTDNQNQKSTAIPQAAAQKSTQSMFGKFSLTSRAPIWKSATSWKIAIVVFLTIALVEACILNFSTIPNFQHSSLQNMKQIAKTAIIPQLEEDRNDFLKSPLSESAVERIFETTNITGLAIYNYQANTESMQNFLQVGTYGSYTLSKVTSTKDIGKTFFSFDGSFYEFTFQTSTFSNSYIMAVRLDSSGLQEKTLAFVIDTIKIMLLMSLFVTAVLMIALGRWLLEPLLFMRESLLKAFKNPENPDIEPSPFDPKDEIGAAIEISQNLIKENAKNLKQIKIASEDKIHQLAYFDTLTSLPNRTQFLQTLNDKIKKAESGKLERIAIIALDLDHFKDINDSMGHNVGDAILRGVAKRLRTSLPESVMVSRSGEDEFAITAPLATDINSARDIAERVATVIRGEPFDIFNESFQVRASVGVATFPDDGSTADVVLKNADIALNRAKEEGRDTIKEYSEDFDRAVQARFQMLRDLRDALEHNQLDLFYQPQLDLKSGKIIGAEALLRWWKPDNSKEGGSFVSPGEFIPVAEQSGLIVPIGEWVMRKACEDALSWRNEHGIDIRIAINVSAAQFTQSDLVSYTQKVLKETKINPHHVELEVTESVFMDDINHTIQILKDLHGLGVELAIDDFGTGYSSLSYLRQFPIDRLKIDQSFIRNALENRDDEAIARTIITLGHSLSLSVIAEGVETKEHEDFLIKEGCDEVQGFRYSRPVPAEDFVKFATDYTGDLKSFAK